MPGARRAGTHYPKGTLGLVVREPVAHETRKDAELIAGKREEPDSVPGLNSGLSPGDPTPVAAFRSALLHQGVIAFILVVFLWLILATVSAAAAGQWPQLTATWRCCSPATACSHGGTGALDRVGTGGGWPGHGGQRARGRVRG